MWAITPAIRIRATPTMGPYITGGLEPAMTAGGVLSLQAIASQIGDSAATVAFAQTAVPNIKILKHPQV